MFSRKPVWSLNDEVMKHRGDIESLQRQIVILEKMIVQVTAALSPPDQPKPAATTDAKGGKPDGE